MKQLGLILFMVWLIAGCETNAVYKEYTDIEDGKWYIKNAPSFTFEITDASVPYNIYYNLRNSLSYGYYNLYLTRYLRDASGKELESRLDELILMDPKTGKPNGDGLGDLFDHKVLMKRNYRFPKPGKYSVQIRQYMRQDPLLNILSVGVTVEKAGPAN
ncbi:gliding motility lipoprotein GldH [Spirosoma sp. KCTC 42546]|uniref:gliding motility lipoprotein GldH n=1 Tax=Spirosoma sp. KCTC 42546 TaxID=2520506 RepID=UPI00115C2E8C|nr:gliding motility lipoprotein GldH [Spirosoma sp. KCTC 42546]QDK82895.1 gliding motility lipoprotein GldH [Spirosoma sp. KCTC 42546]